MDAYTLSHVVIHMAHDITEQITDIDKLCLVGVNQRGYILAKRLAMYLETKVHVPVPVYTCVDYVSTEKTTAVLILDTMATGKTACTAVYKLLSEDVFQQIVLATVVDIYNQRCVPLMPQIVGKRMFVKKDTAVCVRLWELGEEDGVLFCKR